MFWSEEKWNEMDVYDYLTNGSMKNLSKTDLKLTHNGAAPIMDAAAPCIKHENMQGRKFSTDSVSQPTLPEAEAPPQGPN